MKMYKKNAELSARTVKVAVKTNPKEMALLYTSPSGWSPKNFEDAFEYEPRLFPPGAKMSMQTVMMGHRHAGRMIATTNSIARNFRWSNFLRMVSKNL